MGRSFAADEYYAGEVHFCGSRAWTAVFSRLQTGQHAFFLFVRDG
jgi:hypothetical protein